MDGRDCFFGKSESPLLDYCGTSFRLPVSKKGLVSKYNALFYKNLDHMLHLARARIRPTKLVVQIS